MGYFGFPGMNNFGGNYSLYGNTPFVSGPGEAKKMTGCEATECYKNGESESGVKGPTKGISGFFNGLKNGVTNTVKGLFSIKGLAITAGSIALVALTGGAALIPLAALGLGVGGYQAARGISQGNTEQVGEGVFTAGASLLGVKMAPTAIGNETLANTSLWGKISAPFVNKGVLANSSTSYWGAARTALDTKMAGLHGYFMGTPAKTGANGETIAATPSWLQRSNDAVTSGRMQERMKGMFRKTPPTPNMNGNNPQNPTTGTEVTFSERAVNYLNKVKNAPHTASTYMGAVLGGNATAKAPEAEGAEKAGETFYY